MQLSITQKTKLISIYPELRSWFEQQDATEALKMASKQPKMPPELISKIKALKGDKGEKGDQGDPYKLTQEDVDMLLKNSTPVKGKDYYDGKDGKDGVDGRPGFDGRDGKDGKRGPQGEQGIQGKTGRDGSPDTALGIANKINTLNGIIEAKTIRGLPNIDAIKKSLSKDINDVKGKLDMRWHGSGLSKVTTDSTLTGQGTPASPLSVVGSVSSSGFQRPLSGIVNGINRTFTWTAAPNAIVVDETKTIQKLQYGDGVTTNWSGTTTTILTIAPSIDIFAVA